MVTVMFSVMNNKEVLTRKRISEIYNKRQEDFPSLREYNDYLEEVEDIIFLLVEGHDVESIEAKVAKYKEENYDQIVMAQARKAEERAAQRREQSAPMGRAAAGLPLDANAEAATGLAQNGMDATNKPGAMQYMPTAPGMMMPQRGPMMVQPILVGGGDGAHPEDKATAREREVRGIRAGGYTPEFGRKRALEEAFSSLFLTRVHY